MESACRSKTHTHTPSTPLGPPPVHLQKGVNSQGFRSSTGVKLLIFESLETWNWSVTSIATFFPCTVASGIRPFQLRNKKWSVFFVFFRSLGGVLRVQVLQKNAHPDSRRMRIPNRGERDHELIGSQLSRLGQVAPSS